MEWNGMGSKRPSQLIDWKGWARRDRCRSGWSHCDLELVFASANVCFKLLGVSESGLALGPGLCLGPGQFEMGAWIGLDWVYVYRPGSIGEFGCSRWSHSIEESEMVRTLVSR